MSFIHTLSSGLLPETMTQCRRIIADGGTIVDQKWMDRVIRTMKAQGIYSSCKFLGDANFAYRNETGVDTLYDISGNNNDAVQATDANQPVWTAAQQNGKAGLLFTAASTHFLNIDSVVADVAADVSGSWVQLTKHTTNANAFYLHFGDTNASEFVNFNHYTDNKLYANLRVAGTDKWAINTTSAVYSNGGTILSEVVQNATAPILYINGTEVAQGFTVTTDKTVWLSGMAGVDNARLGCRNIDSGGNTAHADGSIMITGIFSTALSTAQRTAMESLINSYYAIY